MSADAAAVFAAGLDFGFLSTFDAADAAFALVTSLFDFAMLFTSFLSSYLGALPKTVDSLLTKSLLRSSFYDENVGYSAKEKGQTAQKCFLLFRNNTRIIIVVSTADETDGVFAARLRAAREQRELNQTELAKKTGLQPAAIGHFEANRRKPSFANIRALAKALEVSSDYLLGRADTIKGSTTAFRNEESLNHADRESIQLMIDTLARRRADREK